MRALPSLVVGSFAVAVLIFAEAAMAESGEPLKQLEVGSYAELGTRPNPQQLVIQFIPSLVAILLNVEKKKGSPLTQAEVEVLRDKASVVVALPDAARAVETRRGYKDIDPSHAWQEWQVARVQLHQQ